MSPVLAKPSVNRQSTVGQTAATWEEITVKRGVLVALLVVGFATPAAAKFYTTINTVGDCGIIEAPKASSGMEMIGPEGGYDSREDARAALADNKDCKGIVE